jgi:hypothetical protein
MEEETGGGEKKKREKRRMMEKRRQGEGRGWKTGAGVVRRRAGIRK